MDTLNYIILVKIGTKFLGRLYWNHHKQQKYNKTINNKTTELVNNVSIFLFWQAGKTAKFNNKIKNNAW